MLTRERILLESMKLFSIEGFDAVSIRKIAKEVGIRDSALYKHFTSKKEILDTLVEESKEKFINKYKELSVYNITLDNFEETCMKMFNFQVEDEWLSMFRRLLIIEQFKNPYIAEIYKEFFIDMPIRTQTEIFKKLIDSGLIKDNNPEVMAIELYSPFYIFHTAYKDKNEIENLLYTHLKNFKTMYLEG